MFISSLLLIFSGFLQASTGFWLLSIFFSWFLAALVFLRFLIAPGRFWRFLYYLVFLFGFSRGVRRYLAVSSSFNGGFRSFNDGLCCFLLVLLFLASGVFWRVGGFC